MALYHSQTRRHVINAIKFFYTYCISYTYLNKNDGEYSFTMYVIRGLRSDFEISKLGWIMSLKIGFDLGKQCRP